MITYVATKNQGKLAELEVMFEGRHLALATFEGYADVVEDEESYLGNARLKARALRAQLLETGINAAVLADDSGLEVEALGGRPGVRSARYAGIEATWAQRRRALLDELRDVPPVKRNARFISVLVLMLPTGEEIVAEGFVEGCIAERECGDGGFGYDPVFYYAPAQRTFAEMDPDAKNRCSHRRRAADALLAALRAS